MFNVTDDKGSINVILVDGLPAWDHSTAYPWGWLYAHTQALGVLLFKLCFMDTPFGDNPLAIVSAQYSIPEDSPYTQDLHNLRGETTPTHTHPSEM